MVTYAGRPLVLIRGFGGLDVADERSSAYQGFNDGTVYEKKRGDNYIYEGFVLRALKSDRYRYSDATNVIGYYKAPVEAPDEYDGFDTGDVSGTVAIDPGTAARVLAGAPPSTVWVYRYYDLEPRSLARYGAGLVRLIDLIRIGMHKNGMTFRGIDVVAHSMGGLVVREALLALERRQANSAQDLIHRIVTLGTPHRGIAFQRIPRWILDALPLAQDASDELASFSPSSTRFLEIEKAFPVDRILTVVGTNYRAYGAAAASFANRLSNLFDGGTLETNRSDGLVKQSAAQLPGAPRAFVHKCHGGVDSLVTSRESYEIAMRFFHGTHRVRLWLDRADITRGSDWFGRSEFYLGVSIKPRYVDFELFHQSSEAENCYGPCRREDLADDLPDLEQELRRPLAEAGDETTGWAGPDRLLWEGWVDAGDKVQESAPGLVFRLDLFVCERDTRGIGFSDNRVFGKQYYAQVFPQPGGPRMFLHTSERYLGGSGLDSPDQIDRIATDDPRSDVQRARRTAQGHWTFDVGGTGFSGTVRLAIDAV